MSAIKMKNEKKIYIYNEEKSTKKKKKNTVYN